MKLARYFLAFAVTFVVALSANLAAANTQTVTNADLQSRFDAASEIASEQMTQDGRFAQWFNWSDWTNWANWSNWQNF